jgi:phospholipid-binding lipoprotein MlaA
VVPRLALALACLLPAVGAWGQDAVANRDPLEALNRKVFAFNTKLDRWAIRPAAEFYRKVLPDRVEYAVYNFFDNLAAPVSIAGAALQGDPERTLIATGRFAVNTTLGVAGLFDPATRLGLPDQQEDIGQALEVWGLENTPYLVLPFWGPVTLTTLPDRLAIWWLPPNLLGSYWHPSLRVVDTVSFRASALAASSLIDEAAVDPYSFTRESFLQRRRFLRYNGNPPIEDLDQFFDEF